jgi:hypothetical protein
MAEELLIARGAIRELESTGRRLFFLVTLLFDLDSFLLLAKTVFLLKTTPF